MSRPSSRMVCAVCEIFSSAAPAISIFGVESAVGGWPPRPCAQAGAAARTSRARVRFMACILLFVGRAAARLRHVFLFHPLDVELRRAGDDLVQRLVEIERGRLREPRVV